MQTQLDAELKKLLIGTNEQRRRVGQAVFHFYRTLVFWNDKGLGFLEITRAWSIGGAAIFDSLAATLRELDVFEEDVRLRAWLAEVLGQLSEDLARGDHMLFPYLRWLEGRFPTLTALMQEEQIVRRVYDYELARVMSQVFARAAESDRGEIVDLFVATAAELGGGVA